MVQYPAPRSQPPYRLLFLGRWHPNKGIDLLLEALHMLTDVDWQQIEVVEIQGGGPMQAEVKFAIDALQAQGRPVVQGRYLAKAEAEAAIARADWVLIPSRIESIPVVFSDAMKMMRPVVTMPVGDLSQLLQRQLCGVLTTKVTADAYSIALRHAIKSSTLNYVEGVQAHAQNFNLPLLSKNLIEEMMQNE